MSIFNRLFGSKKEIDEPDENQQKQPGNPEPENPEKKLNPDSEKSQTNSPVNPEPEIKKKIKETEAKVTESKTEMPQSGIPWRTFSIFISSTFADMQAERDHLKNVVFPLVEEELQKHRIKLEIVDLRWGVDTTSMAQEDEREASVLKVCLDEIRRCRPFFIGLLGDRYGWVPPLERMKTALVGETHIIPEKGKSVTDLEIEFGVLASKEQLVRSVFYFREPLNYATFSKKKAAMFSDEHNDELNEAEKKERKTALLILKAKIVTHFIASKQENKVKTYSGTWDVVKEKLTGLEIWGETVYADILAECENHAKDNWDKVPQNLQEQELALLYAFTENNTTTFCGRKPLLETLKQHLLSGDTANWGLVLTGESGSGKSAVFSMVNKMLQKENCFILAHSAGISPRAKKVADLLKIWNNLLRKHLGIDQVMEDTSPSHPSPFGEGPGVRSETPIEELQKLFTELLQLASAKKRVVLLIDALDRFEPTARAQHLSWLPSVLPQNVRLLCTTITGTEKKAVQYHKGLTAKSIDSFTFVEAKDMLDALCLRQHKDLPAKIEKIILEKKRAGGQSAISSPLWLSLAVNMLMAIDHDDFEKMSRLEGRGDQQIESYLVAMANGFDPLPGPLFLSLKNKAGLLFGETFTANVFNYLAISRNGLREKDLEKLLPANNINWDPLRFANLRRWFKVHLVLQGEELQWNLAHSILRNTIIENLSPDKYTSTHFVIATHLLTLPGADSLRASETMLHLLESEKLAEAASYYGGNLTDSEKVGATVVLAEAIATSEKGLQKAVQLPHLLVNQFALLDGISRKYVYNLNKELNIEGNLPARLNVLTDLYTTVQDNIELKNKYDYGEYFGEYYAFLSANLGHINQSMGHMEEALKYFEISHKRLKELDEANPNYEWLKNRLAASYQYLGSIHQSMGHMDDALQYFKKFSQSSKELYETYPHNTSIKDFHAVSYSVLGNFHQAIGQMEEALKYFESFNQLSKELYNANPRNEHYKEMFASSNMLLGNFHQSMGHMEEALKYFEDYNILNKELYENNPRSELLKTGLANSYLTLGGIHVFLGHMKEAHKYYESSNQLFIKLFEASPLNEGLKTGLALTYSTLGDIHQSMGHMEEALKYNDEAVILCKKQYEDNPLNEKNKIILGISYYSLGSIHQSMGHMEEALKCFEIFNQISKEQYEANSLEEINKMSLGNSYDALAFIHKSMGHTKEALKYFKIFNQLYKEFNEAKPLNWMLKNALSLSCEELGSIYKSMGDKEEALKYFELNNKLRRELYEANLQDENMKNFLADSFEKLGDINQSMGHMKETLKYFELNNKLSKEYCEANPLNEGQKQSLALSYEKLGSIHKSMGHKEEALKYFESYNKIINELYETNPLNESFKWTLSVSFERLGSIHQSMGQMAEALKYFKIFHHLSKELYEANPINEQLKKNHTISNSKLGSIYQSMGQMEEAIKYIKMKKSLNIFKRLISYFKRN